MVDMDPYSNPLKDLCDAIPIILAGNLPAKSYRWLSSACRQLVLKPMSQSQDIFDRIKLEIDKGVAGLAREWRATVMSRERQWLCRLVLGWRSWEQRCVSVRLRLELIRHKDLLSAIFVYLDRVHEGPTIRWASARSS